MSFFDNTFPGKPLDIRGKILNWYGSDTYKRFRSYRTNVYDECSITYKLNDYGFRSDNFVESKYRIVFLGCSATEGIGLPLEETFSHIIYTEIKKKIGQEFPYWNLGLGGCGLDSIVRCYYNFYELLKPQVVISLFPGYRLEYFTDNWFSALPNQDVEKIFSRNPFLLEPNIISYSIEKNLTMLDLLFEQNKALHIWDRWDEEIYKNIDLSKLNNFKNYNNFYQIAARERFTSPMARDGIHFGRKVHDKFARLILDTYGDMICDRLVNGAS